MSGEGWICTNSLCVLLLPLLVCPCYIQKIGSARMLAIQCETQLFFFIVILLKVYIENHLIPQEIEHSFALNLFSQVLLCKPVHFHTRYEVCSLPELLWCSNTVHFFSSYSFCHSWYKSGTKLFWSCTHLKSPVYKNHQLLTSAYLWKHVSAPRLMLVLEHLWLNCTSWYFRSFFSQKRWHTIFFLSDTALCSSHLRLLLMSCL